MIDIEQQHYTVPQLSRMWHVGAKRLQRWFSGVPGVLDEPGELGLRTWRVIPKDVAVQVYRKKFNREMPEE